MLNVLVLGNGAREHAIVEALSGSCNVYAFMNANNPGIMKIVESVRIGALDDVDAMVRYAVDVHADIVVVGPELPLSVGVVDALEEKGIRCVGPTKALAQLETSKSYTRDIMTEHNIPGLPKYKVFSSTEGLQQYLEELQDYVLKPDGLTGGKGVQVKGDHFDTHEKAIVYCNDVIAGHGRVVVEEKLVGEEFSLMSFTDGKTLRHMPAVQDHKRAFEGDKGPNTGGMGSYSDVHHSLPFLNNEDIGEAKRITEHMLEALKKEENALYKGIMYGGFIVTAHGVKLIEYNARFGDPEAMNVLSIMKTPLLDVCRAIVDGNLDDLDVTFENKATVCKYVVPAAYPNKSEPSKLEVGTVAAKLYYAAVDQKEDGLYTTGSRAIAVVGVGNTLEEAEQQAEDAVKEIKGNVRHRADIGTKILIEKRIMHMGGIR